MEILLIGKPHPLITLSMHNYRPFVEARAEFHHFYLIDEIGFAPDSQNEYKCRPCIHMDAFRYLDYV